MVFIRETSWKTAQITEGPDRLQQLQESIYQLTMLLLPDSVSVNQCFCSQINDKPALHMQVLEQHPYTTFLRLTHELHSQEQQFSEPEAHIRMYHDLRIAEVTSFDLRRGINRIAGPDLDPSALVRIHWRQNRALHKWLEYLVQQGHSLANMQTRAKPFHTKGLEPGSATSKEKILSRTR